MSLVKAGDTLALTALYDRHARAIHSLARILTRNEQDAEDLAQDAFLRVWHSAESYRAEKGSVRKWIFCVVRNRNIDLLRSRASHRRAQERAEAQATRSEPSEAFVQTWRNSRRDRLLEALEVLPHEQHEVLALAHLCCLTHPEIAELLCVPLGTVKGRLRLGLKKLRDNPGVRGLAVE